MAAASRTNHSSSRYEREFDAVVFDTCDCPQLSLAHTWATGKCFER